MPVLLGPAALAFAKGGYFDVPRLVAGVVACALVIIVAARDARPVPRSAYVAVGGLAALTVWTGLSILWAPIAGGASDDFQRLLLYLFAFVAAIAVLRPPEVRRWVEPVLLAGIVAAALYGLSERLLPGVFSLEALPSADNRLAWPLTYWNAMGALTGMGLVLAAWVPSRTAAATAPILGLACYLTFSRGALGATAAGLAVLIAVAPTLVQARRAAVVAAAAVLAALATVPLSAVEAPGGSAGQGAAMLAVLVVLGAAAAWLVQPRGVPRRTRAERNVAGRTPRRAAAPSTTPARVVPHLRWAALGALALALVVTAVAVTRVERTGGGQPAQGATPERLVSAQSNRYEYWRVAFGEFGDHPLPGRRVRVVQDRVAAEADDRRDRAGRALALLRDRGRAGAGRPRGAAALPVRDRVDGAAVTRGGGRYRGAIGLRGSCGSGLGLGAAGADAGRADARREARHSGRSTRRQLSVASTTEPANAKTVQST